MNTTQPTKALPGETMILASQAPPLCKRKATALPIAVPEQARTH